jgi:transposase
MGMRGEAAQQPLFVEETAKFEGDEKPRGRARTREPVREQGRLVFEFLDSSLPEEHAARLIWRVVEAMDVSALLRGNKAVEGRQGRARLSPKMLLSLWLYAVSSGVGSAREIVKRTETDAAFRWIVGEQRVGHAKLSEFLTSSRQALEKLFTDVLSTLMHRGLLDLSLVAQDGTRIRASAAADSFRRAPALEECRQQAALHVQAVLSEGDDAAVGAQLKRLREAKARHYEARVEQAIAELAQSGRDQAANAHRTLRLDKLRASTTDPQARVMKMPDGGFRPGYNVQLATAGSPMGGKSTIVAVRVTNLGSDAGSVAPMLDAIKSATGAFPKTLLADGNHDDHASIRAAHQRGVVALIPCKSKGGTPRSASDLPIVEWRARMQTEQAKALYRCRAPLSELSNARLKCRFSMAEVLVRGLANVTAMAFLVALSMNLLTHARGLL